MLSQKRILGKTLIIMIVFLNIIFAARWLFDGNLLFHTDIARDFYLMKDIWDNKNLTLIGARAGGLTGWFHGPLWLYINLPAYILGQGNPVIIACYWLLLNILTLGIVFVVARKIFDSKTAFFSVLIYSSLTILDVHGYINPQGALMVFPIFFYFYWKYRQTKSNINLAISLFLVGLLVQFQIAFGAPILILTIVDNVLITIKDRKISRFLAYLILLIPLSTYILFELRHGFLQLRSISNLAEVSGSWNLMEKIRLMPVWFWTGLLLVFLKKKSLALSLFSFFYIGFWVIAFLFRGQILSYYYMPFLPVLVIIIISLISKLNKYVFMAIISYVIILNLNHAMGDNLKYSPDVNLQDSSSWNSVKTAANWALNNCGPGAGYFFYTADLYSYNLRYALDYQATKNNIKLGFDKKNNVTCLLIGPNVSENPYGSENWKSGDIRISGELVDYIEYGNGIKVEKYLLEDKDINISPNPLMIKDIFFR
jgi:hypothetical protein